jgi:hypothetical protein
MARVFRVIICRWASSDPLVRVHCVGSEAIRRDAAPAYEASDWGLTGSEDGLLTRPAEVPAPTSV